jgi:hypothetical protein
LLGALDRAGACQPAGAAYQVDAVVCQPAFLAGVRMVGHHEVPPRERGLDVDLGPRSGVARALNRLPGTQQ